MGEGCFCHFNGYEVKDAAARKDIDTLKAFNAEAAVKLGLALMPQMFGALADGVTDDTAAVQAAIYAGQEQKKPVVLRGTYVVTAPLVMDDTKPMFLNLIGNSLQNAKFRIKHNGWCMNLNPNGKVFQNCVISGIRFLPHAENTPTGGIIANRMTNYVIRDCMFGGIGSCIYLENSWCGDINNCILRDRTAINYPMLYLGNQCNQVSVRNCVFSGLETNLEPMVKVEYGKSVVLFDSCTFEKGVGISLEPNGGRITNVTVLNCYFEWMVGECIKCSGGDNVQVWGLTIIGCYFNGLESSPPAYAIECGSMKHVLVQGCHCTRYANAVINNTNYRVQDLTVESVSSAEDILITAGANHYEITNAAAPTTGTWQRGTICWNRSPSADCVGWVCTANGTPGTWIPF
jgi:hypothetical protein